MVLTDDNSVSSPILEATSYYPFGLQQKGISLTASTQNLQNKYLFNDGNELQNHEFSDGSGLELYDATFRSLDPQLGRFWQIDILADYSENLSPYTFASNNPILFNDPLGLKDTSTAIISFPTYPTDGQVYNYITDDGSTWSYTYYSGSGWYPTGTTSENNLQDVTVSPSWWKRMWHKFSNLFKSGESTQPGGIPLVTESGGASPTTTHAEHPDDPVNVDMLLLVIGSATNSEMPDNPVEWAARWSDIGSGVYNLSKDGKNDKTSSAEKVNPASTNSKTPNLGIDPMFLKKGNVIYHRDVGQKTRVNGDGTETLIIDDTPANDTFPHEKLPIDYTYPH
jgi:RHS repeat-associated protein